MQRKCVIQTYACLLGTKFYQIQWDSQLQTQSYVTWHCALQCWNNCYCTLQGQSSRSFTLFKAPAVLMVYLELCPLFIHPLALPTFLPPRKCLPIYCMLFLSPAGKYSIEWREPPCQHHSSGGSHNMLYGTFATAVAQAACKLAALPGLRLPESIGLQFHRANLCICTQKYILLCSMGSTEEYPLLDIALTIIFFIQLYS